jgi:hypothetical protein
MPKASTQELLDTIKDLVFCLENGSDGFSLHDYRTFEENTLANANKILKENNNE